MDDGSYFSAASILSSCGADTFGLMMSNEAVLATLSPDVSTIRYEVGSKIKPVVQVHVHCLSIATAPRRNMLFVVLIITREILRK